MSRNDSQASDSQPAPVVVVRLDSSSSIETAQAAKELVGQGADWVIVPAEQLTHENARDLDRLGIIWGVATASETFAYEAATWGAQLVEWQAGAPLEVKISVPLLCDVYQSARHGDFVLCRASSSAPDAQDLPEGVKRIVDFGATADRARLAAQVAIETRRGVHGFLTVAPTAVRRANHVIQSIVAAT